MTNVNNIDKEVPLSEEETQMLLNFDPLDTESSEFDFSERINLLLDVPLQITVVLGETTMTLKEVEELGKGSLIELDTNENQSVKILLYGKEIAYGRLVVVDNQNYGVEIEKVVSPSDRLNSII